MDIEQRFWVRVLLLDDVQSCKLFAPSAFRVINSETQTTVGHVGRLNKPLNINISNRRIVVAGMALMGRETIILPDDPHIFEINDQDYRGKLMLIVNDDGNSFDAINFVPLEPYLAGVVGAEMPDYWEPAALQAQAVAARTYCLYIKNHFGSKRTWDVKKTEANQVYLGVSAESARVWDAIYRTWGQVLVCKQSNDSDALFPAYYSSTCGGHTENSKHVFGDSFEPLVGVPCPYCKEVAKPSFFFWPMVRFDKNTVTNKILQSYPKLKKLGKVTDIIPAKQSNYEGFSRLTLVKLVGSTAESAFLRAEDLRLTINPTGRALKSTICKIVSMGDKWAFLSGRGYGHGVGMCQCGAQALARKSRTVRDILFYYYPGSELSIIY
ncbi:MAG: SpoIID/LytB domain-containing protein [Planctomycetota bacterium]|nr:MAG: SpoIID/LytB domain-containing protein [Planctomycetota bacterium]